MTSDSHVRMYTDGEQESLPTISGFCVLPQGATTAEKEEARDKHLAHNQVVETLLENKGFVVTDQAYSSAHRPPCRSHLAHRVIDGKSPCNRRDLPYDCMTQTEMPAGNPGWFSGNCCRDVEPAMLRTKQDATK